MDSPAKVERQPAPTSLPAEAVPALAVPESPAPAASQKEAGSEAFDFAKFSEEIDTDTELQEIPEDVDERQESTNEPAPERVPVVAKAPPTPEPPATPAELPTPPAVKAETPAQPEAPAKTVPSYTPEQIAQERQKLTQRYEQEYAMSEEEGAEIIQSPNVTLPKLAAKMHVQVMESTLIALQQMIPQLMQQELQRTEVANSARKAFFDTWPGLNKPEYMEQLTRIGNSYRANNPAAPMEQYIQEVGAMASIVLKVPPGPAGQINTAPAVPAKPSTFTPAGPGGGAVPLKPKPQLNEFETMAVEFLESDS